MHTINLTLIHALDGYNSHLAAKSALEGLSTEIAGKEIMGAPHTIWQQIAHIKFWQDRFIAHIKGEKLPNVSKAADGWPGESTPGSQKELDDAINAILNGVEEVRSLLQQHSPLFHPPNYDSGYDVITSMATHLSYHLGQIMTLRRILGDYPPPAGGYTW